MPSHEALVEQVRHLLSGLDTEPSPASPCPYLPGRTCRYLVYDFGNAGPGIYHALMDLNFRRNGNVVYKPVCPGCTQCRTLRLPVADHQPNRSQRRCLRTNRDIEICTGSPRPTRAKHALYCRYQAVRHDRQMNLSWDHFVGLLYFSPIQSLEIEYRLAGKVVGAGLFDIEPEAISAVYSYFDPDLRRRSLGTFNILTAVDVARSLGLTWVYLGYYVADCPKMNYKANFRPCEVLMPDSHWRRYEPGEPAPAVG